MPLWLFNPAEPSASQTYRQIRAEKFTICGGTGGLCNSVPRYWQLIVAGATDPAPPEVNGTFVLIRDLGPAWIQDGFCHWSAVIHTYGPTESLVAVLTHTDLNLLSGGEGGDPDWCVYFVFTDLGVEQIYNVRSLQQPNTMFRCCSVNQMGAYSALGGATTGVPSPGWPATITAKPFWP